MTINEIPTWLPIFNLVISLGCVLFSILLYLRFHSLPSIAAMIMSIVLVAGAAFQANLINLFFWTILGTGGRLGSFALIAMIFFYARLHNTRP